MKAKIYNQAAEEVKEIDLPTEVFGVRWNADLVHQVVTAMKANSRPRLAWARGRGDVSGGGKKPWQQKGTGRSRHGSSRSPIWKGGGATHGPTLERTYEQKVNDKMKKKALASILSAKFREGEIIFLDSFNLTEPKTKHVQSALSSFAALPGFEKMVYKKGKRVLWAVPTAKEDIRRSARNIQAIKLDETRNINPVSVLEYKYLVITNPEKSLPILQKRVSFTKK